MRTRSGEGWGQLPRKLALALAGARLNVYEFRIVLAIMYKTTAFNKSKDRIPWSQLAEITGINLRHLTRTINSLLKKGVITKEGFVYGLQEDFSKWETLPYMVVKDKTLPSMVKTLPSMVKILPSMVGSRDLLKRTNQERGFIKPGEEKRERKIPEGLKQLRKDIKNFPGLKR